MTSPETAWGPWLPALRRTLVDGVQLVASDPQQSPAAAGFGPTSVSRVVAVTLVSPPGST